MSSISNSEILAETKDLSLSFEINHYKGDSMRDAFVDFFKNPLDIFNKNADRLHALKKVNFQLKRGERVAILGKNGAGKTTFCRCIAGMYFPNMGEVHVHPDCRAIFDSSVGIQSELTGRENAELLTRFLYPELSKTEAFKLVENALEFSELDHFIDVPYRTYSKGMQARLSLSIISARPCEVLILDEVYDGADQFFRKKVSKRVKKMIEDSGAVIFVSHNTTNVRETCNRVVLFDNGEIIFDGDVDAGIEKYESLYS